MDRRSIERRLLLSIAGEIADREGSTGMNQLDESTTPTAPIQRACLVAGCACKDARIVSHRRAAWFAVLARANGQTANRIVDVDPAWRPRVTSVATPEGAIE
jgi:hypothetical protein